MENPPASFFDFAGQAADLIHYVRRDIEQADSRLHLPACNFNAALLRSHDRAPQPRLIGVGLSREKAKHGLTECIVAFSRHDMTGILNIRIFCMRTQAQEFIHACLSNDFRAFSAYEQRRQLQLAYAGRKARMAASKIARR